MSLTEEHGSAAQSNPLCPALETELSDDALITADDVFGITFIATHFHEASALTDALSDAMHHVLQSDIMDALAPSTKGSVKSSADLNSYRAAEEIVSRVADPQNWLLQYQVLAFVRRRKRLYRYLSSPPTRITWQPLDKADSRLRKFLMEELGPADEPLPSTVLDGCLAGTRTRVLDDVDGAVQDAIRAGGKQVVWITGVVGAGKTAVMSSMEKRLRRDQSLQVVELYCSQARPAESKPHRVFPTIARQLGIGNADVGTAIRNAIDRHRSSATTPAEQLRLFILGPLEEDTQRPTVILIDGLDEYGGGDGLQHLLSAIAGKASNVGSAVFLVSSRPLQPISAKLRQSFRTLDLHHEDYRSSAWDDVLRYIDHRLSTCDYLDFSRDVLPMVQLPISYDEVVKRLARLTDGYFVVASFTCNVILGPYGGVQFLKKTLALGRIDSCTTVLYQQYQNALESIFGQSGWEDSTVEVNKVLAVLCCAREALPASTVAALCRAPEDNVMDILKALSPLLTMSSNRYTLFHASVKEFLVSNSVSARLVDSRAGHKMIFTSCLGILALKLHFNIFGVTECDAALDQTQAEALLSPEVRYASIFWTQHLEASSSAPESTGPEIADFLASKFLFWLEVLSGMRRIDSDGTGGLARVSAFLGFEEASAGSIVRDCQQCLYQWSSDISRHPCQIYLTALPWFSPSFRQRLCKRNPWILSVSPRVLSSPPYPWSDNFGISNIGSSSQSVASSSNGHLFAGGQDNGTVEIQDSLTISPDRLRMASGSADKLVRIWDVETGVPCCEPLEGHTGRIESVAFSEEGSSLVSISSTEMIIWDLSDLGGEHPDGPSTAPFSSRPTPKITFVLPHGYQMLTSSSTSQPLTTSQSRTGMNGNQVCALSIPSYNPWKTLCDAHDQNQRCSV